MLTFNALRTANKLRLPLFKNKKGNIAHSTSDGSDWSLNDWYTALSGEVGEAGNILKKIRRGDYTLEEQRQELAKELADIQIYLDILAYQLNVDLAEVTYQKFNEVSDRIGVNIKIHSSGEYVLVNPQVVLS